MFKQILEFSQASKKIVSYSDYGVLREIKFNTKKAILQVRFRTASPLHGNDRIHNLTLIK